jgi:ribosome maturation factor RimP
VDLTLKEAIGEAATGSINANRKKFRGTLERRRRWLADRLER